MTRFVRLAVVGAGVVVLVVLCARFGFGDVVAALARLTVSRLLLYAVFAIAVLCGNSVRWWAVARAVGSRPQLTRVISARVAGDAIGGLLPGGRIGGDPLRVALLYADGSSGARAGAAVVIDRVMEVIGNTVAVLTYLSVYASPRAAGAPLFFVVVMFATVGVLMLLALTIALLWFEVRPFSSLVGRIATRWWPRLRVVATGVRQTEDLFIRFLHEHPLIFMAGVCGALTVEALSVAECHYLFAAFDLVFDLPTLLMVMLGAGLARLVPSPAGIGALESSQVAMLAMTSGRPDIGFVAGMILRLHETVWLVTGLVVLAWRGVSIAQLRFGAARTVPRQPGALSREP